MKIDFAKFDKMLLDCDNFLFNLPNCWPNFARIPPELGVVSKLVKIKCDSISDCKNIIKYTIIQFL